MNITGTSAFLGNFQSSVNKSLADPRLLDNFQIKIGVTSSPDGILGGVLSQEDYETFKSIADKVNVNSASNTEMKTAIRSLLDTGLLKNGDLLGVASGPVEFDSAGSQINTDVKYNQQEYQRQAFPHYAGAEFNQTRGLARDSLKIVNAIAKASSQTGVAVSSQVYAQQDIDRAAAESVKVSLSGVGKGLAAGESKKEPNSDIDIAMLLLQMAQAAKARDAAQAAAEVASSSAAGSGPSQDI